MEQRRRYRGSRRMTRGDYMSLRASSAAVSDIQSLLKKHGQNPFILEETRAMLAKLHEVVAHNHKYLQHFIKEEKFRRAVVGPHRLFVESVATNCLKCGSEMVQKRGTDVFYCPVCKLVGTV